MSTPGHLVLRVDASPKIGSGHALRCLALAQAWADAGGSVGCVTTSLIPKIEGRFQAEHISVVHAPGPAGSERDIEVTRRTAEESAARWLVVDGYVFDSEYQKRVRPRDGHLLVVDDHGHAGRYIADAVLDQNLPVDAAVYRHRSRGAQLLLGPRYALLRRELTSWRRNDRVFAHQARRLLVTFGGSDLRDLTGDAIRTLASLSLEVRAVVGPGCQHTASLRRLVAGIPCAHLEEDPPSMAPLFAWAEIALSAAGSTCWELCLFGVPSLLVVVAPNQLASANALAATGAASLLDEGRAALSSLRLEVTKLANDRARRMAQARLAQELVDGHGAERVVNALSAAGGSGG